MRTRVMVVAPASDREALIEWLHLAGFDACGATQSNCLGEALRFQPDVVLVDVQFPAYSAAQALRALGTIAQPPRVLCITPRPVRGLPAGFGTCMPKPLDFTQLRLLLGPSDAHGVAV